MQATLARRLAAEFLGTRLLPAGHRGRIRHHGRDFVWRQRRHRASRQHTRDRRHPCRADPGLRPGLGEAISIPRSTLGFLIRREITPSASLAYVSVQIAGGLCGVWLAHVMFGEPAFTASLNARTGSSVSGSANSWRLSVFWPPYSGACATARAAVPYAVGLFISAGYWFTSSTSFANPAVTIARSFTDTFSGIRPEDAPWFILMQLLGSHRGHYSDGLATSQSLTRSRIQFGF